MNKEAALTFLNLVVENRIDEAYERFIHPDFQHHSAHFPGDRESLKIGMIENGARFPDKVFEVQHTLEDGDYVAVHSRLQLKAGMPPMAVMHLFRFENGIVIEMWDLGQQIPEDSPNENGAF